MNNILQIEKNIQTKRNTQFRGNDLGNVPSFSVTPERMCKNVRFIVRTTSNGNEWK